MNIGRLLKKDDPLEPLPNQRIGRDGKGGRRSTAATAQPVYPDTPTKRDVKETRTLLDEPTPRRTKNDDEERDWYKIITSSLFILFAIALIGVGALLSTKAGTPNNMALVHGENAAIGIMLVLTILPGT
jgi:hypothetical protein